MTKNDLRIDINDIETSYNPGNPYIKSVLWKFTDAPNEKPTLLDAKITEYNFRADMYRKKIYLDITLKCIYIKDSKGFYAGIPEDHIDGRNIKGHLVDIIIENEAPSCYNILNMEDLKK